MGYLGCQEICVKKFVPEICPLACIKSTLESFSHSLAKIYLFKLTTLGYWLK